MSDIDYLISAKEVCKQVGLSRVSICLRMSEGRFPAALKLSSNVVRWRQSAIKAWIENLPSTDVHMKAD